MGIDKLGFGNSHLVEIWWEDFRLGTSNTKVNIITQLKSVFYHEILHLGYEPACH